MKPLSLRERGWGEGQRSPPPVRTLDLSRCTPPLRVAWPGGMGSVDLQAWRRSPRRASLSLLVQRKEPKKHAPGGTPCASLRVRERAGNFRKAHPYAIRKRRHPWRRPTGFTRPASRASWGPKDESKTKLASDASGVASGPPEVRQSRWVKPVGRRTWMCAVFVRGRMPRTKIPAGTAHPPLAAGGPPGCAFFAYFLCTSKESRASAASGAMHGKQNLSRKAIEPIGPSCMLCPSKQIKGPDFVGPHPNPSPGGRGAQCLEGVVLTPAAAPTLPCPRSAPVPASRTPAAAPPATNRSSPTATRTASAPGSAPVATAPSAGPG